jgi:hypothetical protein
VNLALPLVALALLLHAGLDRVSAALLTPLLAGAYFVATALSRCPTLTLTLTLPRCWRANPSNTSVARTERHTVHAAKRFGPLSRALCAVPNPNRMIHLPSSLLSVAGRWGSIMQGLQGG